MENQSEGRMDDPTAVPSFEESAERFASEGVWAREPASSPAERSGQAAGAAAAPAGPWQGPQGPTSPIGVGSARPGRPSRFVAGAAAALVLMAGGYGIRLATSPSTPSAVGTSTSAVTTTVSSSGDVSQLVARAQQAVVKVTSQVVQQSMFGSTTGEAVGTGFVVSSDGLILTNDHVVEAAQSTTVTMNDGRQLSATVVNANSAGDLALLRVNATGLKTLALGDSSSVQAGEAVVAIGYALDLQGSPTVTTGIISSTSRTVQVQDSMAPGGAIVRTYNNALQTSAAINEGNSGGPLLDLQGRVIGIDSAGAQNANNIGFAIPINQAKALIGSAQ